MARPDHYPSGRPNSDAEPADWNDAGEAAYRAFEELSEAKTLIAQAGALGRLHDAMSDLATWLPGWDYERGVVMVECPLCAEKPSGPGCEDCIDGWRDPSE